MTSETLQIFQTLRDKLLESSAVFQNGYIGSFKDRNGDIYFRDLEGSQEIEDAGVDDREGNYFYIRFIEREQGRIEEADQISESYRQRETIPLRFVGIFRFENMFEVLDNVRTAMLSFKFEPFRNVESIYIVERSWYVDYINGDMSDTSEHPISPSLELMSIAIDFDLINYRSGGCRQPEDLIN